MWALLVLGACDGAVEDKPDVEDRGPADTDVESDADTDADGDTDTDADTDSGGDTGPIERSLDDADMLFVGQEGDNASYATVGDFDGDGTPDIAVSAPTGYGGAGLVYVAYSPSVSGETYVGELSDRVYGEVGSTGLAMSGTLDADGDGVTDALLRDAGNWSQGRVSMLLGPFTGARNLDERVLSITGASYGYLSVYDHVADIDADGVDDIALWTTEYGSDAGAIAFVPARWEGVHMPEDAPTWIAWRDDNEDMLGLDHLGDMDGDGAVDAVLGVPYLDSRSGAVYVFAGPLTGAAQDARTASILGSAPGALFGNALRACDFDADGHMDLAIAAPNDSGAASDAGSVIVVFGPISGERSVEEAVGAQFLGWESAELGTRLAVGRFDGDVACDVAANAVHETSRVYIWSGVRRGTWSTNEARAVVSGQESEYFLLRAAGDIDGFGADDLLVGWGQLGPEVAGLVAVFSDGWF